MLLWLFPSKGAHFLFLHRSLRSGQAHPKTWTAKHEGAVVTVNLSRSDKVSQFFLS